MRSARFCFPAMLAEINAKSILVKSKIPGADFAANPYIGCSHGCIYCYADYMGRFGNHPEPWGEFVDVKNWPAIKKPKKYAGKKILLGSATDGWQPCEAEYGRSRLLLEQLYGSGCELTILTKSGLILRDLDLIKSFANAIVIWSINTHDETVKNKMDRAAPIAERLEAMAKFHEAGVRTGCFIAPIMPGLTDEAAIGRLCEKFCDLIWRDGLNLRGHNRLKMLNFIGKNYPELIDIYRQKFLIPAVNS